MSELDTIQIKISIKINKVDRRKIKITDVYY